MKVPIGRRARFKAIKSKAAEKGKNNSYFIVGIVFISLAVITLLLFQDEYRDDGDSKVFRREIDTSTTKDSHETTKLTFEGIGSNSSIKRPQHNQHLTPRESTSSGAESENPSLLNQLSSLRGSVQASEGIKNKRRRIAYAITITKDGHFQDGAAVLAYSIYTVSKGKDFDVSLVAFVHPNVTTSRPALQRLGYHVIVCPTPINSTAIPWAFLRDHINKNGCCGASELIKLNSYR
jgi:hypothetical protein